MSNTTPTHTHSAVPAALIDLCDDLHDLIDYLFFLCDALEGMLSTEVALEPETVNGIWLFTGSLKQRARRVMEQAREVCEGIVGED